MSRLVKIDCQGDVRIHLPGVMSDYATLCGLDGDDVDQETLPIRRGEKVDCDECRVIWEHCRTFRSRSFEKS